MSAFLVFDVEGVGENHRHIQQHDWFQLRARLKICKFLMELQDTPQYLHREKAECVSRLLKNLLHILRRALTLSQSNEKCPNLGLS